MQVEAIPSLLEEMAAIHESEFNRWGCSVSPKRICIDECWKALAGMGSRNLKDKKYGSFLTGFCPLKELHFDPHLVHG